MVESSLTAIKGFELARIFSLRESDGIFEQACQLFAKGLPLRGSVVFVHLGQFGEQMIETPLLCQGTDFVIGAPEVADENSPEQGSQDLLDHRGSPAFGDQIVAELFGGETPQPVGDAVKAPAGLIGIQDRAFGDPLADVIIDGLKEDGEVFPGLGQSSGAYFEAANNGKDLDDIVDADADQIMEPGREHHQPQSDHGVGQGIRNGGEDDLFALRAPIAMDRVLCHLRFLNRGNVFGITLCML